MASELEVRINNQSLELYLELLSKGYGPMLAAKNAGIQANTVAYRRATDPSFAEAEADMKRVAIDRVDHDTMYLAAIDGDINAAEKWLKAHDRENWGADRKITIENKHSMEITATTEGIIALQAMIAERRALMEGDFIEAEVLDDPAQ